MFDTLRDSKVLVVGRSSGIARAIALSCRSHGADVVVAGRHPDQLAGAYDDPRITAQAVDLTDDDSIAALADRIGTLDHVVSTASAVTNGAVDFLTRSLAVELAPIRVNTNSPGVIDTGAWDPMGVDGKQAFFDHVSATNPSGRIGSVDDVAHAVLFAITNTFLTGTTLKVDGGEPLI